MSTIIQLQEQAKRLDAQSAEAQRLGDLDKALKLMQEAAGAAAQAKTLQDTQDQITLLRGEYNHATNAIPLAEGERQRYDPKDRNATRDANYRPPAWVKSLDGRPLSAAIQPKWVREQMGQNLKDEAAFYADTWEKWFRSRKEQSFWNLASQAEVKAMQENTDVEGGFFVPEEYRTIVLHDPGAPGGVHRPLCTVINTSLKDGYMPTLGSVTWAAIQEEAAYGDNTPTVGQVSFSVAKSGGTVKVSAELLEDAATNLPALLSQIFNEARGRYEDQKIIAGSGAGEPEGLRVAVTATQSALNSAVTAADILTY